MKYALIILYFVIIKSQRMKLIFKNCFHNNYDDLRKKLNTKIDATIC